jgi:hypothetical protein
MARWTRAALLSPWRLARIPGLDRRRTALYATAQILSAAGIQTLLSPWTYLIGKGLILGTAEMDLGQDDLPPDTPFQVGLGLLISVLIWSGLFSLLLGVCRVIAQALYGNAYAESRRARRHARVLTVWLTVGAVLTLVVNGLAHQDVLRPASAIREHVRLRLQHPSDVIGLEARERFLPLLIGFGFVWAIGLEPPSPRRRLGFAMACLTAYGLLWLLIWRMLPWVFVEAWTG